MKVNKTTPFILIGWNVSLAYNYGEKFLLNEDLQLDNI